MLAVAPLPRSSSGARFARRACQGGQVPSVHTRTRVQTSTSCPAFRDQLKSYPLPCPSAVELARDDRAMLAGVLPPNEEQAQQLLADIRVGLGRWALGRRLHGVWAFGWVWCGVVGACGWVGAGAGAGGGGIVRGMLQQLPQRSAAQQGAGTAGGPGAASCRPNESCELLVFYTYHYLCLEHGLSARTLARRLADAVAAKDPDRTSLRVAQLLRQVRLCMGCAPLPNRNQQQSKGGAACGGGRKQQQRLHHVRAGEANKEGGAHVLDAGGDSGAAASARACPLSQYD